VYYTTHTTFMYTCSSKYVHVCEGNPKCILTVISDVSDGYMTCTTVQVSLHVHVPYEL